MQEIVSLDEITKDGRALVFIYGKTCGWSQKATPMIEAFEEIHPEIKCYQAEKGSATEFVNFAKGTPTFGLYVNGVLISKFGDGRTTLAQMELAWEQRGGEIRAVEDAKKSVKPAVLFVRKSGPCEICEEMEGMINQWAEENKATYDLYKITNDPQIKQALNLNLDAQYEMPIIAVFQRGEMSKYISFGKVGPKFLNYFVVNALNNLPSSGNCKG